ncbi:MAG: hypothetical protein MUO50_07020, partial [Longimicrobiales bacterium]|nr:hypothetical protein [Longimicrobiales bacterium]
DFSDLLDLRKGALPYQALQGWAIHLGYSHRQELPPVMVKEISRAGWRVESVEAYPYILPMQTAGGGLQQDLVRRLALLLRGVAGLVEKYGPGLRSPEGGAFHWSGSGLTLLFAVAPEMDSSGDQPPPDLQGLFRGIEEAGLESEEEIQDFVAERVDGYNHTPLEGLAGLSPAQAQALIGGGVRGEGILRTNEALSAEELSTSDFLANARLLLERLDEAGGTKATVAGNLTRAFVKEMLEAMRFPPGYLEFLHRGNKVVNEEDAWPLHVLRVNLDVAGLIKLRKGTFSITKRGRSMLPPESAGRLYAHLFRSYFGKFNMDYRSRFGRSSGLQSAVPLLLWLLGGRAEKWISVTDLADLILPPRPRGVEDEGGWRNDAANLHHQVLDPLVDFGLLEEKPKPEAAGERYPGLKNTLTRKTPLFDRFLRFVWD